jgi:hypothetical protein
MAEVKMFLKVKRNKEFSFAKPLIKIDNKIQDDSLIIILQITGLGWISWSKNCNQQ